MKALHRFTALLLAVVLAVTVSIPAFAAEPHALHLNISHVNPLYADVLTEDDLRPAASPFSTVYSDPVFVDTVEEAGQILRNQMTQRSASAAINIKTDTATEAYLTALCHEISDAALKHTGVPTEGDYLRWQFGGWNASIAGSGTSGNYDITITYTITHYTTPEQEETVDAAVERLLTELDLSAAPDYEKIAGIYKYICDHVMYDHEHLNDTTYMLKHTAYAALIDETAVCQGYAALLYRLALELGVDCRLIAGSSGREDHGWNIVELNDLYYNVDSTWDAQKTEYDYFLKSEANFPDHFRFEEYTTDSFHAAYPMSPEDFDIPLCPHNGEKNITIRNEIKATCQTPGSYEEITSCADCGVTLSEKTVTTERADHTYVNHICTVCGNNNCPHNGKKNITIRNEIKATCQTPGSYEEITACADCGVTLSKKNVTTERADHTYVDGVCQICGEAAVKRVYGEGRAETALEVAEALGEEKFDAIIIANGEDEKFADALTGSYLANVKGAPILLYRASGMSPLNYEYIAENLNAGGTVYLLGGEAAIPAEVEKELAAYTVKRLAGATRFDTNLAILKEAGVTNEEILIARGYEFADSLSASATGLPILVVNDVTGKLTEAQIEFLEEYSKNRMTILGGTAGISEELEKAIEEIVGKDIARCAGATREETSVAIAEAYIKDPDFVVVAYSRRSPDGLCGGPLAYKLGVPLLLVNAGQEAAVAEYIEEEEITAGYVLGGEAVLSDETVKTAFNLPENAVIVKK